MTDRLPIPTETDGLLLTHFLVVDDIDRSRDFYAGVLRATVVRERDPAMLQWANSWLILNVGGGPTEDKPGIDLTPPQDTGRTSGFLNVRVADIKTVYEEWSARGANFLTAPVDHGVEIRAYLHDPDGHLIEVGQTTGL
jgi:lactoylglutathione lyase